MYKTSLIALMLFFSTTLWAQQVEIISKQKISSDKKVIDLFVENNETILLTEEGEVLKVTTDGLVNRSKINGVKSFYEAKVNNTLPKNFDINRFSYLTRGNGIYYACFFDWSYSSSIIKIDALTGEETFFRYIVGTPGGLFISNGKVWYLGSNHIICYNENITNPSLYLFNIKTPLMDAKGLCIDEKGLYVTFENQTHSLIRFKVKGGQ